MNVKNPQAILRLKIVIIVLISFLILISLILISCHPQGKVEKLSTTPPVLYDALTNQPIPTTQQWLIPVNQFSSNAIETNLKLTELSKSLGEHAWLSPSSTFNNQSSQLHFYLDFGGQQSSRKDAEFYVLPICTNGTLTQACTSLSLQPTSTPIFNFNTANNTEYQAIQTNQSWHFYGHSDAYVLPVIHSQQLQFLVNAQIPTGYQNTWLRLSINENPITPKPSSFFLGRNKLTYFPFLLLFIPLLAAYLYRMDKGFQSYRNLSIGLLVCILFAIHSVIWDLHYMVLGCLLLSLAGVLYAFARSLYRLVYGIGALIIAGYAQQFYNGFNSAFLMQTGLIFLIGIGLFFRTPD
ncbi:hypothetical protein E0H82_04465 [Acinetobacter sp. ANC 4910]|uniref:hypothetical protein n=1 Tax=Acinetobacter sp. ANC 4910 TaxID=2529850 RepID=UPI0010388695|nr:hypothetical protein [Acinetobacter sp. ANC 4910]TCB36967.1 hypothetical protein E0H82_04465 [Acinetobacter sp. ANC 4910]